MKNIQKNPPSARNTGRKKEDRPPYITNPLHYFTSYVKLRQDERGLPT